MRKPLRTLLLSCAAVPLLIGVTALPSSAANMSVPAEQSDQVAATQAQVRIDIVSATRWQLVNPRPFEADGVRRQSVPNIAGHYNYLGHNGSNENRNIYTSFKARLWCGDFARWVWTSGGTISAPVPEGYASSQNWRTGVGSRWHAYSSTLPQIGDVLVWTDKSSSDTGHVAVVTAVDTAKKTITYIGGNEGTAGNSDSIVQHSDYWSRMGVSMSDKNFRGFASRF